MVLIEQLIDLLEALDSPYEYKITQDREKERRAAFNAAGRDIVVSIEFSEDGSTEVVFYELKAKRPGGTPQMNFSVTGSGDEFRVFATVIQVVKDTIRDRGREMKTISFTSEKGETSRLKLYTRLANRISIPGWERDIDHNASDYRTYFTFKRKKNA